MSVEIEKTSLARRFIDANPTLKDEIGFALTEISENPFVDADTKFFYPVSPAIVSLYVKNSLWVLYRLTDTCTKAIIWNIGKQGDKVTLS